MRTTFFLKNLFFKIFILLSLLQGCQTSEYEHIVKSEKAKGIRYDTLWLGMHFGMQSKHFYDTCRVLNHRGILSHGSELPITTRMDVSQYFSQPVFLNFFPEFNQENKEKGAESFYAVFVYKDWAPWRHDQKQSVLLEETQLCLQKMLGGNPFLKITHPEKGEIWVKVDGNRQILLFPFETSKVKALITNLW